tara:strand:+ start:785 stop:1210 length:426 start_codon:yes stop_codon:yes gene_type:complete
MSTQQTKEEENKCDKCSVVVNQDNFYRDQYNNKNYERCYDCGITDDEEDTDDDSDSDTDSEDKREGDYYIVRLEECIYDKDGEVSGMETLNEEEFDHLRDARERYNDYEIEPYGELVYLDMITCDGEDQENIDCKGTMKKE